MKHRICLVSDLHGTFPELPDCDLVIDAGDRMPNETRGYVDQEKITQRIWVEDNLEKFKMWLGKRTYIYTQANHCYHSMEYQLRYKAGLLETYDVTDKPFHWKGINIYGFRYIPRMSGEWAGECTPQEMENHLRWMQMIILEDSTEEQWKPDSFNILLAHCPPYGILDEYGDGHHGGNSVLATKIIYGFMKVNFDLILSGHVHTQGGQWDEICGIPVCNGASDFGLKLELKRPEQKPILFDLDTESKQIERIQW